MSSDQINKVEMDEILKQLPGTEKALGVIFASGADPTIGQRVTHLFQQARFLADDVAEVEKEIARYEERYRYSARGSVDFQVTAMLKHIDHLAGQRGLTMDALRQTVLNHLLAIRLLVNMVLNGDWTHAQKNHTIQALGELVETGIKNLRENQSGDYLTRDGDIFAPDWSLRGQYRRAERAEKEAAELRAPLLKNGITLVRDSSEEHEHF